MAAACPIGRRATAHPMTHRRTSLFRKNPAAWAVALVIVLAACAAPPAVPAALPAAVPSAVLATLIPEFSATLDLALSPPLPVATPSPQPTLTLAERGLTCATPRSLMLHSAFGGERAADLADAILARGYEAMTYRDVLAGLERGECPPENAIIVSLDDLNTRWNRQEFYDIIAAFQARDLPLVLAVVAHDVTRDAIWETYREWSAAGFEIASHSANHLQFSALSEESLVDEIQGSYRVICRGLGLCPVTLILPFGDGLGDPRVLEIGADYVFHIGISGGQAFGGQPPFQLGRIPPDNDDQDLTLDLLDGTFGVGGN